MKSNLLKISFLFLLVNISCGFGYVGDLPDLSEDFVKKKEFNQHELNKIHDIPEPEKPDIPIRNKYIPPQDIKQLNRYLPKGKGKPLAPKNKPGIFSGIIIRKSPYALYLKDMDDVLPILEKLKITIVEEQGIQKYSAVSKNLNFYVNYLEEKYHKRPEQKYESYEQLISVNNQAQNIIDYWIEANSNVRFISNYESNGSNSQAAVQEYLDSLLNRLNELLLIIKESGK